MMDKRMPSDAECGLHSSMSAPPVVARTDKHRLAALDQIITIVKTTEQVLGSSWGGSNACGVVAYKHVRQTLIEAGLV